MESASPRKRQNVVIRLWFEVGHRCDNTRMSTSLSGRAVSFDWRVWVRSSNGHDMSPFIEKVVFNFHPSSVYTYPKRIRPAPPYEVKESSFTSINMSVVIYIKKHPGSIKKLEVKYNVYFKNHNQRMAHSKRVYHDFVNPSDELQRCLLKCGGKEMASTGVFSPTLMPMNRPKTLQNNKSAKKPNSCMFVEPIIWKDDFKENNKTNTSTDNASKVVAVRPLATVDTNTDNRFLPENYKPSNKQPSYQFVEPVTWKHDMKTTTQIISGTPHVDFSHLFKDQSMTDCETDLLSKLYLSQSCYEKQSDANIVLPPITDPIYQLPELPMSLEYYSQLKISDI